MTVPAGSHLPPGDSREQQEAERHMLDALGVGLGTVLEPRAFVMKSGVRVEIDGVSDDASIAVECWVHQGAPRGGQMNKPILDAFKLMWLASTMRARPRLILCLSDDAAARPFTTARSWRAQALRDVGVEVIVVDLDDDLRSRVTAAQVRQVR